MGVSLLLRLVGAEVAKRAFVQPNTVLQFGVLVKHQGGSTLAQLHLEASARSPLTISDELWVHFMFVFVKHSYALQDFSTIKSHAFHRLIFDG